MTLTHGFELVSEVYIQEYDTTAKLYRHQRTGAELLSLENSDENKAFSVNFQTIPADSTGVPHILEHSVLCGSRKYPLKEPFIELLKGSMQTFVNAITFSDMTCYPVASTNMQDFYNLIDVYMDAVFYPFITEKTFQQEGWHYELNAKDAPLVFKGVVFNEMKGSYSSPERILGNTIQSGLMPDTPYVHDAGGDPEIIPDLTYEDFKNFHRTFYHPSNARFYFYGDDNPEKRLEYVNTFISEFEQQNPNAAVNTQPRFESPRRVIASYDAGEESGENKSMVTVAWLLNDCTDLETSLALSILEYILIDTPASPLRRALIGSGLGEDLAGGGVSPFQRELYFATGLKGTESSNADAIEALILDTLRDLADNGIEPDMVEAAMNTTEFTLRENNSGNFPRGLVMMFRAMMPWMHGGDPLAPLAFEDRLNTIKEKVAAGGFFEGLIQQYLLDNTHRVTTILEPDNTLAKERAEREVKRLDSVRAKLNDAELEHILEETRVLRELQEKQDPPEKLALIPSLTLDDMEKEHKPVPCELYNEDGTPLLHHDLVTNGIIYLDLGMDLHTLPAEYLPWVNIFGRALVETGTDREDFIKFSQRIGRRTGGIEPSIFNASVLGQKEAASWLFLRSKAMTDQAETLLEILEDVLQHANFGNMDRIRQIVLEEKAGQESMLVPAGHIVSLTRLGAHLTEAGYVNEQIKGIDYLFFLRDLVKQIDNDPESVQQTLETMRQILVSRRQMIVNLTLDEAGFEKVHAPLTVFLSHLPDTPVERVNWDPQSMPENEGLAIPAQVNYVAMGASLNDLGYTLHGSHRAITRLLQTTWLWEKIRVQGGAYGGFCTFNEVSGTFAYASYRDPNLLDTLENYKQTATFLKELPLSQEDLVRPVIGAISQLDSYRLPDAKGFSSLTDWLTGQDAAFHQARRDELLAMTPEDVAAFADALIKLNDAARIVILGSGERMHNDAGDWLEIKKVL